MSLTVSQIYSVRFGTKLPLPKLVQDNIAKLRIAPATYKPSKPPSKRHHHSKQEYATLENWRLKSIISYVKRVRDKDDPDYEEVFAILNKISKTNVKELTDNASALIAKRDQEFRLRVTTLLFDKAITQSMFAEVMADCALHLTQTNPDIKDDLLVQVSMFPKLYDINTTLTYPDCSDAEYEKKVEEWMKQKDKRRGYAKFLTHLFVRGLVDEDIMVASFEQVMTEMKEISKQAKTEQTEENTTQYVDFIFESSKLLPSSATKVKEFVKTSLAGVLSTPKVETPSLGMRSRFRLEDALKCVQ